MNTDVFIIYLVVLLFSKDQGKDRIIYFKQIYTYTYMYVIFVNIFYDYKMHLI